MTGPSSMPRREVVPRFKVLEDRKPKRRGLKSRIKRLTTVESATRARVFDRDGGCLLANEGWGDCFGHLTPHHIVKVSQGGSYTDDNLATLCSSHNDRIEADADLALFCESIGLVIRRRTAVDRALDIFNSIPTEPNP